MEEFKTIKKRAVGLLIFIMAVTGFVATGLAQAANGGDETAAVIGAAGQFYSALNAMFTGDAEPMKEVWSHADDVTYMGPGGGFQNGWGEVLASWEEQATMKLGGKVTPEGMRITVGQDIAMTHNYESGENVDKDGQTKKISIRATNMFRKENGQWKMIGHHTDLLPYLEKNTADQ